MLHGIIVGGDSDVRESLLRVMRGLDWEAEAFPDLDGARARLGGCWVIVADASVLGAGVAETISALRAASEEAAIVVVASGEDESLNGELEGAGVEGVLTHPLVEAGVVDVLGAALVKTRK